METPLEIFDRADIVKAIEDDCLSASGGSSVLLCHQKAGKTYLLNHLFSRDTKSQDSIFCRVNMDLLLADMEQGDKLSDKLFLDFFLTQLSDQIGNATSKGPAWAAELAKTQKDLAGAADGPERAQFQYYLTLCQRKLEEVATLQGVKGKLDDLLGRPAIRFSAVSDVLFKLESIRKRVVLFMDDYHKMIRNPSFSNALFSFLRGADQQGYLITLASSRLQLMHESLHDGNLERSQLFNHFQARPLEPFDDALSLSFLDWQSRADPPLTAQEKSYLRELGGRLPYFLRKTKEEFLRRGRPADALARLEFEQGLSATQQLAFYDVWLRCSPAKRAILKGIADGGPCPPPGNVDLRDLQRVGYIIHDTLFSRLFSEFIKEQSHQNADFIGERPKHEIVDEVVATVEVAYQWFPTALAYNRPDEPLITFVLKKRAGDIVQIALECELVLFSPVTRKLVPMVADTTSKTEALAVVADPDKFRTLTIPTPGLVRYRAVLRAERDYYLKDDTHYLTILPLDYFVFARLNKSSNKLTDFTWLIAAWVQRTGDALEGIKRLASQKHADRVLGGYNPNVPDSAAHVRAQAKALYDAVRDQGLIYDNNAMIFHKNDREYTQRVRLPGEVLKSKFANCLDGSVLFASLLSACDLHPVILFIPGHAIVGWKTRGASNAPCEFLDTSALSTFDFAQACAKGQEYYEQRKQQYLDWEDNAPDDPAQLREISNFDNFAIPVSIHDVYKSKNVLPLPTL